MEQHPTPDAADEAARWLEYERRKQSELARNPDPQDLAEFCRAQAEELSL